MDTPTTPVHNAKGGMLFVLEGNGRAIHESDLTPAQRRQVGLPPLEQPPTQHTEEVGPDV